MDATTLHTYVMKRSQYVPYDQSKLIEESTELIISNWDFNGISVTSFNISSNTRLKRIEIGNDCFGKVRMFDLDGLSELESVVIGQRSFTINKNEPWRSERTDGSYRIVNCPKLESIQIGEFSYGDYHFFEISNLHSLQSITLGKAALNPVQSAVFESE